MNVITTAAMASRAIAVISSALRLPADLRPALYCLLSPGPVRNQVANFARFDSWIRLRTTLASEYTGRSVMRSSLKITSDAKLVELEDGSIHVLYEGVKYTKHQFVPFHIFGVNSSAARHTTAASFVTGSMIAKFGDDHEQWPAIALKFLLSNESP
jgi:hypothetical protein